MKPAFDVIVTEYATSGYTFDWSGCRSPSRAKRRHAQGHRTRLVVRPTPAAYEAGDKLYVHPAVYAAMKKRLAAQVDASIERALRGAYDA
jgi:hypothetical protein